MEVQDLEKMVKEQSSMSNMERDLSRSAAFPMLMRKVYIWMTMALVITGLCAWGVATSPSLVQLVYGNRAAMWVLLLAELGLVFYTTARINRLSLSTATTLFIAYAALNGVTMSFIFMAFTTATIAKVFFITAATFGATAVYGYVTKAVGQSANQAHAFHAGRSRRGRAESGVDWRVVALPRLHQPLPLSAQDIRKKRQLKVGSFNSMFLGDPSWVTFFCGLRMPYRNALQGPPLQSR